MNKTLEASGKRLEDMTDADIDYSDIPPMTREEFAECLVRFPNKSAEQGGEWHKSAIPFDEGDVTDEELAASRARFWQMASEDKATGTLRCVVENA